MDPTVRALFFTAAVVCALWAAVREYAGLPQRGLFPLAFALSLVPPVWDSWEAA